MEQLAGTRGRAVTDKGTSPQGQEEGAGLCFSGGEAQEGRTGPGGPGLYWLPPSYSWSPCSTRRGQGEGSPSLPRRVKGAQGGRAACRPEQNSSELAENQVGALCFAGIIPGPHPA